MSELQEVLLDRVQKLNIEAETKVMELGVALLEVQKTGAWAMVADSFMEYCTVHLHRSKPFVTKLITAVQYMQVHGRPGEIVTSAEKLYLAIQAYPEKEPDFVIAAANSLTKSDLEEANRERIHGADHIHIPKDEARYALCACGKMFKYEEKEEGAHHDLLQEGS